MSDQNPPSTIQDLKAVVTDIENELLDHITKNMNDEKLTVEQAQQLAREFLAILPPHDKRDLLEKLKLLSKKHPQEVTEIYLKYATPEYEHDRDAKLAKIAHHLHTGDVSKALEEAKK